MPPVTPPRSSLSWISKDRNPHSFRFIDTGRSNNIEHWLWDRERWAASGSPGQPSSKFIQLMSLDGQHKVRYLKMSICLRINSACDGLALTLDIIIVESEYNHVGAEDQRVPLARRRQRHLQPPYTHPYSRKRGDSRRGAARHHHHPTSEQQLRATTPTVSR